MTPSLGRDADASVGSPATALVVASVAAAVALAFLSQRTEVLPAGDAGAGVSLPTVVLATLWLPPAARRILGPIARRARRLGAGVRGRLVGLPGRLAYRVAVRRLQRRWPLDSTIEGCGNYWIAPEMIEPSAVVYSFGVGDDIRFDEALVARAGCVVHLFDPTPIARSFAAVISKRPALVFHPWGVWVEDGPRAFYFKNADGGESQNLSITNLFRTRESVTCQCYRLATIMANLGHTHVDLVKMDIEGAALPVLGDMLDSGIRPRQLVFELERGLSRRRPFHRDVDGLLSRLAGEGYALHFLPRPDASRYNFMFLAVDRSCFRPAGGA